MCFKGSNLFTDDGTFKARNISLVVFDRKYVIENRLYQWLSSIQIKTIYKNNEYVSIGQLVPQEKTVLYKTTEREYTRRYSSCILKNLDIVKDYDDIHLEQRHEEYYT